VNATLGTIGVWAALVTSLVGAGVMIRRLVRPPAVDAPPATAIQTGLRDGRWYPYLLLAGALLATAAMERALITHDFTLVYVADNNSRFTPLLYSITGMWSALAGSILLWGVVLAAFTAAVAWRFRRRAADPVVGWAIVVLELVSAFFFGLMAGPANPFLTLPAGEVSNGLGPNALLQDNPLVAIHPPFLYLGFVGLTVPFAFTIGMLITGRVGDRWLVETRRWTLLAWTCLTVGIVLGAWWSYEVLGWGGFWGWDPVENAALLPWLCSTAYLHSVLVQERRGLLRVWNLSLSVAAFSLTILATFLTRSGVIESVHSFSESSLGPVLIAFFFLVVVVGFGLIALRGDRMRSPGGIDAPLGREGAFLLNNLVFVGFAFIVMVGTLFPLLYQAMRHQQVTVGAPFFDTVAAPAGIFLLFLMAVAPALSWRKVDAAVLWRRLALPAWAGVLTIVCCAAAGVRGVAPLVAFGLGAFAGASALRALVLSVRAGRRHGLSVPRSLLGRTNGGMIVHLGVVLLAVGITAASSFAHRTEIVLRRGQTVLFDGRTFQYVGTAVVTTPSHRETQWLIRIDRGGVFRPAISQFGGTSANAVAVGTPAIDSSFSSDVYLTVDGLPSSGGASGGQVFTDLAPGSVAIGVTVQPLVSWMWVGGILIGIGGMLALFPGGRRRPTDPVSAPPSPTRRRARPGAEPDPAPVPALTATRMGPTAMGTAGMGEAQT